jgi:hypothetical protein
MCNMFTAEQELREQMLESMSTYPNEPNNHVATSQRITIEYGLPSSLNQMTEDEAMNLAMMLSVEDEEARENWISQEDVEDLDLDGWSLDDVHEDGTLQLSTSSMSQALSLSSPAASSSSHQFDRRPSMSSSHRSSTSAQSISFTASPTPSNRPASERTSPYFRATRPSAQDYSRSPRSNEKLQLSPQLRPTYGSFGQQRHDIPVPDMSEELWPSVSSSLSNSRQSTPAAASTPIKRGWNDVVQASSPSPASTFSVSPSLLSTQLRGGTDGTRDRERREEEELRFALELSLVEEMSKKDS